MKKHLFITCIAYMYIGFGAAVHLFGYKAGLSPEVVVIITISSVLFFLFAVFTSMEKMKEQLFKKEILPESSNTQQPL